MLFARHRVHTVDGDLPPVGVLIPHPGAHHRAGRHRVLQQPLGTHQRRHVIDVGRGSAIATEVAHAIRVHAEEVGGVLYAGRRRLADRGHVKAGQLRRSRPGLPGMHHRGGADAGGRSRRRTRSARHRPAGNTASRSSAHASRPRWLPPTRRWRWQVEPASFRFLSRMNRCAFQVTTRGWQRPNHGAAINVTNISRPAFPAVASNVLQRAATSCNSQSRRSRPKGNALTLKQDGRSSLTRG